MMKNVHSIFVGIDWATNSHQVCVIDNEGSVIEERKIEHSRTGMSSLADRLLELAKGCATDVGVAIEVTRGPVVELLLERGFHVHSVNPKQLDRFRDRHTVAGAKDDLRDAYVLADSLRTDRQLFKVLKIDDPLVI